MGLKNRQAVLWIDCCGGIIAGLLVIACHRLLAVWERLPPNVVFMIGIANLVYGSYSLFLVTRRRRSEAMVCALAVANMIWFPICLTIVMYFLSQISVLGKVHLIGEGLYVGGLGFVEWRMRKELSNC